MNGDVARVLEQIKSCLRYEGARFVYALNTNTALLNIMRERDRQRQRERQRQRDRERQRQTDKQTDRQTGRDRERERQRDRERDLFYAQSTITVISGRDKVC